MSNNFTRQTPPATRAWLTEASPAFPEDWTLNQVADECHRRYLAGRWRGGEIEAGRAIVAWAAHKLATFPHFTNLHWNWLAALDMYDREDGYSRLIEVLQPAVAAVPAWRTTEAQRTDAISDLDKAAAELLRVLESAIRLDISLAGVVGWYPEMQPLLDRSRELQHEQMERGRSAAKEARDAGLPLEEVIKRSLSLDGYHEPRLSHFLWAFRAALKGTLKDAKATQTGQPLDVLDDVDPEDAAELRQKFGLEVGAIDPKRVLRTGGDFGAYPNRAGALRRAVILAFPKALYVHRMTAPPPVPIASTIEAACLAWFGSSPTQKEINAMIKPDRDALEPAMRMDVSNWVAAAEKRALRKLSGLSPDAIRGLELQEFLSDDADLSAGIANRSPNGSLRSRPKGGNPPKK